MLYRYRDKDVFYEQTGQGSPVLTLHGWGCDHAIFDSLVPVLSKEYSVYALDFPGFGASEEPDSVWGVELYTQFLEAFCKDLGIENPGIVAHSFGGRVAILFASRNACSRLFLMDAAGVRRALMIVQLFAACGAVLLTLALGHAMKHPAEELLT